MFAEDAHVVPIQSECPPPSYLEMGLKARKVAVGKRPTPFRRAPI